MHKTLIDLPRHLSQAAIDVLHDPGWQHSVQQLAQLFELKCDIRPAATTTTAKGRTARQPHSELAVYFQQQHVATLTVSSEKPARRQTTQHFLPVFSRQFQEAVQNHFTLHVELLLCRQQNWRWQAATDNSFGVWDWHLGSDQLTCSGQWFSLLGFSTPPQDNLRRVFKRAHRHDRTTFKRALRALLRGESSALDCETRFLHQNGHYVWLRNRCKICDHDPQGQPVRIIGTSVDIQHRKIAEEQIFDLCQQLQASEARYRQLMQHASDAILISDLDNKRIIAANEQAVKLSGYSREELCQLCHTDLFSCSDHPAGDHKSTRLPLDGLYHNRFLSHRSGRLLDIDVGCTVIEIGDQRLMQCIIHDISAHKETQRHLFHLAHHDALTGLPNRVLFQDRLQQAILKADRYSTLVALCFIDMDDFKQINDRMGHDSGDFVLKEVAQRLREAVRTSDTVARLGGDEFVLLLQDLERSADIQPFIEKLHHRLNAPLLHKGQKILVTCSIGVSVYPLSSRDADQLLALADTAMYRAKESDSSAGPDFFTMAPAATHDQEEGDGWGNPTSS